MLVKIRQSSSSGIDGLHHLPQVVPNEQGFQYRLGGMRINFRIGMLLYQQEYQLSLLTLCLEWELARFLYKKLGS